MKLAHLAILGLWTAAFPPEGRCDSQTASEILGAHLLLQLESVISDERAMPKSEPPFATSEEWNQAVGSLAPLDRLRLYLSGRCLFRLDGEAAVVFREAFAPHRADLSARIKLIPDESFIRLFDAYRIPEERRAALLSEIRKIR